MSTKSPGSQRQEIDWLTPLTRTILFLAQQEAAQTGMTHVQPEHLLLVVVVQGECKAATLLNERGFDAAMLRAHMEEVYGSNTPAKDTNLPLSRDAKECVERAIAMIVYYLTRHRPSAKVTPDHLVLSIISHPSIQKLLVKYPTKIVSVRKHLTEDMEPGFLHHVEDLLLFQSIKDAEQKVINLALRNNGYAKKNAPAANSRCPSCMQPVPQHWKHCAYCGIRLAKQCARCGTPYPNVKGAKFCIECGSDLA
jgi:Double zinc ribbon/Clp amino terminal domain, pathogenicity island component